MNSSADKIDDETVVAVADMRSSFSPRASAFEMSISPIRRTTRTPASSRASSTVPAAPGRSPAGYQRHVIARIAVSS